MIKIGDLVEWYLNKDQQGGPRWLGGGSMVGAIVTAYTNSDGENNPKGRYACLFCFANGLEYIAKRNNIKSIVR